MNRSLRYLLAIAFVGQFFLLTHPAQSENLSQLESTNNSLSETLNVETSEIEAAIVPESSATSDEPSLVADTALEESSEETTAAIEPEPSSRSVIRSRIFDVPSMCQ
jgi:hypothetical protein